MTDLEQGPPRDHREIPSSRQKQAGETDTTGRQAMDDTVSVEVLSTLFIMQSNRPFNLLSSPLRLVSTTSGSALVARTRTAASPVVQTCAGSVSSR